MKQNKFFDNKKLTAAVCAAVTTLCCMGPLSGCAKSAPNANIIMSEIVASNKYSLAAADGSSPDWIELYNPGAESADLSGFGLTDDPEDPYLFTFPEGTTLGAGEYMVVYCTGAEDTENEDGVLRAGFKISSTGETLCLSGRGRQELHLVELPELAQDVSFGAAEDNSRMVYYASPTPGAPNGGESNDTGIFERESAASTLAINEFMSNNKYSVRAKDGETYSWVEIINTGDEAVNLSSFGLSNDETNPNKWKFPDIELAPGQLQLVFLSGSGAAAEGEYHANFSLNDEDKFLTLCDSLGNIVDYVSPLEADGGVSVGLYGDSLVYFGEPTPGLPNTTKPYTDVAAAEKHLGDVYISEVKSKSEDDIDWIELYNKGTESVSLAGWGLSDSGSEPFRYQFGEGESIGAGEYKVIDCSGKTANIRLSRAGENVYLTKPDGSTADRMNGGTQNIEISRGRKPEGDATPYYFASGTKGSANTAEQFTSYASQPSFSQLGGYVSAGTRIEITAGEGDSIYYTTDGSEPTQSSSQYSGPITISESTPLRARCYGAGKLPGVVTTENYIIDEKHDIPVVCISIAPEDFSGSAKGIYAKGAGYDQEDYDGSDYAHTKANYWQDWERPINFEWFEADGTKGIDFDAGIKIFGQFSRELAQKSFAIKLRGIYGQNSVTYPFFRDYDYTTFYNLILRQSGQDWATTKIKDAMIGQMMRDTNVEVMEYRPCAVYINGEYWGLYNLREKQDEDYVVSHYPDAEKGKVDVLKGDFNPNAGDAEEWRAIRAYIKGDSKKGISAHDMSTLDAQNYIEERVDMYSLYDWLTVEALVANTDTGNKRRFKYDGGKWRWMLFDTDWALQENGSNSTNRLAALMNSGGHGSGNRFCTHMQVAIMANQKWRKEFVERYAELLNTTLTAQRFETTIDAMAAEIRSEMPRQVARWSAPESVDKWEANISALKTTAASRCEYARKDLKETFGLSEDRMKELFPNG